MNNLYLSDVEVAYEAVVRAEEERDRNAVPVEHSGILKVRLERLPQSLLDTVGRRSNIVSAPNRIVRGAIVDAVTAIQKKVSKVNRKPSNTVPEKNATVRTVTIATPRSTQKVSKVARQPRNTVPNKSAVRSHTTTKLDSRSSQEASMEARQLNSTVPTPKRNAVNSNVSQKASNAVPKRHLSCIVCGKILEALPGMPKMRIIVCSYECSTFNVRE